MQRPLIGHLSGGVMQTSITLASVSKFLKTANTNDLIYCSRIRGLHIIKTVSGASYRYRYTAANGKRRVKAIGSVAELKPQQAAEIAVRWRNEGADPLREAAGSRAAVVAEMQLEKMRRLGDYIKGPYSLYQSRKKSGKATINLLLSNFADLLNRDMSSLTRHDIQAWQQERELKGLAHSTIKRAYGALKTMLNYASLNDAIKTSPLSRVNIEPAPANELEGSINSEHTQSRRQLTNNEINQLMNGLALFNKAKPNHWFYTFTLLALHTGLRPGDLLSLTWQELNINFKRLVKVPEKTRHHSSPTKIIMDLTEQTIADIKPWWELQGKPNAGLVFKSPRTGLRISRGGYRKAWSKMKKQAGLDEKLDFYALRHDFISRLVAAGVPLLTVARLAGHKSAKMIEQHYGHLCPASASTALNLLDASRSPSRDFVSEKHPAG